jgi:hypothetical protein
MPTIQKPKAWENGVCFSEDIIAPEKRAQIVQDAAERAGHKRQERLRNAITKNKEMLGDGILQAVKRYVVFLNFDTRPLASEILACLKLIKRALPSNWAEIERLIAADDATAGALREAVFEMKLANALEELIEGQSGDFVRVVVRALENIKTAKSAPGPRQETALRTLVLELADAWQNATGEIAGGGGDTYQDNYQGTETRTGPFIDFAVAVVGAIPIETVPNLKNPALAIKKTVQALHKARAPKMIDH